ncbi:hypothetical protein GCM10011575_02940 [Microlunatus endophyticus]|uniref:Lipoprotein n=1 Tax=Microlunatus endophyticus TaxID=1716077 RepID=A0A917S0G8_9ACTN|nr:hypothetical protein [Microlunatus endophyticus]GGL48488.1 hypothetical protein GCM10011575_02940 [Microlunatus endophyticus]
MSRPRAHTRCTGRRAWLLVGCLLAGCSATANRDANPTGGALAAARAYVNAIARLDIRTADKMTARDERVPDSPARGVDITAALPDATDPIIDPWITPLGPGDEAGTYLFNVSYRVKSLTGGGTIVLRRAADADPSKVGSWTVILPLTQSVTPLTNGRTIPGVRIGKIEVADDPETSNDVWGYPGGYRLTGEPAGKDTPTLWFALGADDLPAWNADKP